jgi:hypothetical protein
VWSLGCVYLEFVVWIFGGFESVKLLAESKSAELPENPQHSQRPIPTRLYKSSPFFRKSRVWGGLGPIQDMIHPKVSSCYRKVQSHSRCRGSGLDDLVTMIRDKLLQPDFSKRYWAWRVEAKVQRISEMDRVKSALYHGTSDIEGFEKDEEFLKV